MSTNSEMVEPAPENTIRGAGVATQTRRSQRSTSRSVADETDLLPRGPSEHSTIYVQGLAHDWSPGPVDTQSATRSPKPSDDSGGMSDSHSLPDHGRRAPPRGRPPSRNAQFTPRPPHLLGPQRSSSYDGASAQNAQDAPHRNIPSPASPYHTSPSYPTPLVSYGLPRQFVSGYTLPPHTTTMSMGPSPSFAYGFPHSDNMLTQPMHASYPSMLQPHPTPIYQYQRGSTDGGSSSHPSFQAPGPSQMYQPPVGPSRTSHSSLSPQASNSPSFSGSSQFHSSQYHPHSTPYTYPSQSFPSTPTHFQPPYPPTYPQHFPPTSPEHEHGTWWYVPSHPQSPQYEGHPPYAGHYSIPYPSHHPDLDPRYGQSNAPASTSSTSRIPFQFPPMPPEGGQPLFSTPPRSPGVDPSSRSPVPSSPDLRAGSPLNPRSERHVVRRSYHPNPPANRSEWVMWVGNVPSDATHDEAWRFFTTPPDPREPDHPKDNGVLSIFLISRSCCVFVNFSNDEYLWAGIDQFNGVQLRPNDPRCPKLVCRVRKQDDDLKAGVGGQRGSGLHMRWIKEQKGKRVDRQPEASSSANQQTSPSKASTSSDDDSGPIPPATKTQTSSSGSFASTNSSILARYFPQRFFILKSLTQYDLDLSVETGLWATQKHNERILDQAYHTSKDVFLIFGVNKSGEFYGYARMAGPLRRGEPLVSWASRTESSTSSQFASGLQRETIAEESSALPQTADLQFLSPTRQVADSPGVLSPDARPDARPRTKANSAPPVFGHHQQFSASTLSTNLSLGPALRSKIAGTRTRPLSQEFELDAEAPLRAVRDRHSTEDGSTDSKLHAVEEVEEREGGVDGYAADQQAPADGDSTWGDSFKVEWVCTERLPFQRTRLLRNPWNHDKEIKVSRDGTELEPILGRQLLDEWEKYAQEVASGELKPTTGGSERKTRAP